MRKIVFLFISSLLACPASFAEEPVVAEEKNGTPADKSSFHLFNPVPKAQMRELSPDRPDRTESPYSVDAGHLQFETDVLILSHNRAEGVTSDSWSASVINAKIGITNYADFQLVIESFRREIVRSPDGTETRSGFGDLTPRLKVNFFGNDGGPVALGAIFFATLPTWKSTPAPLKKIQGGVAFPLALSLPEDFSLGMMAVVARSLVGEDGAYANEYSSSIAISHDIIGDLGGYLEFYNTFSSSPDSPWNATLDAGLGWSISSETILDAGVNIGVTDSADDLNPFIGFTHRI